LARENVRRRRKPGFHQLVRRRQRDYPENRAGSHLPVERIDPSPHDAKPKQGFLKSVLAVFRAGLDWNPCGERIEGAIRGFRTKCRQPRRERRIGNRNLSMISMKEWR